MKILFVEPNQDTLLCFRKELVDELIKQGHELFLCLKSSEIVDSLYGDKAKEIIKLDADLNNVNPFRNLSLIRRYKRIIKRIKPDIILSFTIKPNIYCGLYAKKSFMIANITGLGRAFNKKGLLNKIAMILYKHSFKNVDYIFFQNNHDYELFKDNKLIKNDYKIISGSGVNVSKFKKTSSVQRNNRDFLFASRPLKEKGFDLLIQCIPEVALKFPDAKFSLLVKKSDICDCSINRIVSNYSNNIEFLGRTDSMVDFYCKSSFLVSPSYYHEGISNVLLESLACETPIITTNDNPGCMEVLVEGVNGYGVISNNKDSLLRTLLKACSTSLDEINNLGANGRQYVSDRFNRNNVIKEYIELINEIEEKK